MTRPINIDAQFAKLLSHAAKLDLDIFEKLAIVKGAIEAEKRRSEAGRWTYDLNRHLALAELRNAIEAEIILAWEAA